MTGLLVAGLVLSLVLMPAVFAWFDSSPPAGRTTEYPPGSWSPTGQVTLPSTAETATPSTAEIPTPSTFQILGDSVNEFGDRSVRGYAFVIRADDDTSLLLTDYHLLLEDSLAARRTVNLRRGEQTFTATIVAVSPDPHVALLRISGTYPALPISSKRPRGGTTVTVEEPSSSSAQHAAVLDYSGRGGESHLTFSVEVSDSDDGVPVLNSAGEVVGMAEPTSQFAAQGVGFAVPIMAACQAVSAC